MRLAVAGYDKHGRSTRAVYRDLLDLHEAIATRLPLAVRLDVGPALRRHDDETGLGMLLGPEANHPTRLRACVR